MRSGILLLLLSLCTVAYADPTVTSSSNDIVSGEGFGSITNDVIMWDTFESGTNGTRIGGNAPLIGDDWGDLSSASVYPEYTTAEFWNGTKCAYFNYTTTYNSGLEVIENLDTTGDELYMTFYWKNRKTSEHWSRNFKPYIIYGNNGGMYPSNYIGCGNPDFSDGSFRNSIQDAGGGIGNATKYLGADVEEIEDEWIRIEMFVRVSGNNEYNGDFWYRAMLPESDAVYYNEDLNTRTRTSDNYYRQITIGAYRARDYDLAGGGYETTGVAFADDVYISRTQARVEVGNNATFANCTHREIQIPTAWSDTSITVTWNQGSFENNATAYLFVIDADGVASAGLEGTFVDGTFYSEGAPPPSGSTITWGSGSEAITITYGAGSQSITIE